MAAIGDRLPRSALGHAYPGGGLGGAVDRLWHPPPLDARAPEGERLLDRYMPGQRRALILLSAAPDLGIEILMRTGRGNALLIGDPVSESWVASARLPALRRAIARLQPGDRLLMDRTALQLLAALQGKPTVDPTADPAPGVNLLEAWIVQSIGTRFQFRRIYEGSDAYVVAELAPRPEVARP